MAIRTYDERSVKRNLRIKVQLLLIIAVVIACSAFMLNQINAIKDIRIEKMAVQRNIDYQLNLKQQLAEEFEHVGSEEFIKQVARDRLGLVEENDILFIRVR